MGSMLIVRGFILVLMWWCFSLDVRVDVVVALFAVVALVFAFMAYWGAVQYYNAAVELHNNVCQGFVVNLSWP